MKNEENESSILGLLMTQFCGAFNDNAWKVMVFALATRPLADKLTEGDFNGFEASSQLIATLSLVIFLIPMMLFSLPAGVLADQMSKRSVIIMTKVLEVIIMGACAISLYLAPTYLLIPFGLLGLMGMQSALFGPSKYGILPEILPKEKLSSGNGLLEMWTMLAIIAGTGLGPMLLAADAGGAKPSLTWLGPLWLTVLSCVGLVSSFFIKKVPVARGVKQKVLKSLLEAWSTVRLDRILWLAVIGSTLYWFMISLLGQNVLVYAKILVRDMEKGELLQGIFPASFGVGIALGAFLSGMLSKNRIEYGFIPLGSIGFAISSLLLGILHPEMFGTLILLLLMGMSSGLLIVPIHALVQLRSPDNQRGSIIALGNFLDVLGMIGGSLVAGGMAWLGFGLKTMLIVFAFLVVLATIWCVRILPKALVRLCFIILTKTLYKLKIKGLDHLPKQGAMLLVANHVSIIDALFVMASIDRPVRFLMNEYYYNKWYIYPLAKLMETIPVSSTASTKVLLEGLRKAGEALDNGEVVCIFPEGQVSHTGKMLPFRRGTEIITKGRDVPIVPLYLDNVWGSIFSFKHGRFFKKLPQQFPYSLTISFGKVLPANTSIVKLHNVVQEMEYEAWMDRKRNQAPIHRKFINNARKKPFRLMLADKEKKLQGWKVLGGSIALARLIRDQCPNEKNVGILLPTSIPSTLINIALAMAGKVVVNLNFTVGSEALQTAIKQAGIKTVITSKRFLEHVGCDLHSSLNVLFAEDLIGQISLSKRLMSLLMGFFSPISSIEKYCGSERNIDNNDTLAIIFTSGSTGVPKGVVLSHFNVSSNVQAISQVIPYMGKKGNQLANLPMFHSFGYMSMWLGLSHQIGLITHSNPLEAKVTGELVKKYGIKLMMSTPTFLRGYIKQVIPDQFGSLQCIITGAEKLPYKLAQAFEEKFGIIPIEGYGATECSPVIATNTVDVRLAGIYQVGTVQGAVGQTLPGVIVKIVDPETKDELEHDCEGLLLVKGPNVMQGYLNQEESTKKVMHEGWYNTGDIAVIDQNGFITIKDRLRRFSKIGGEMVPHGRVEEALHEAAGEDSHVFAVTAIPDEKKGEKLAVLHTCEESRLEEILKSLAKQGLSNLYIPRLDHFIKVDHLPVLGSGKLDLQLMKKLVVEQLSSV